MQVRKGISWTFLLLTVLLPLSAENRIYVEGYLPFYRLKQVSRLGGTAMDLSPYSPWPYRTGPLARPGQIAPPPMPLSYQDGLLAWALRGKLDAIYYFALYPDPQTGGLDLSRFSHRERVQLETIKHIAGVDTFMTVAGDSSLFRPVLQEEVTRKRFVEDLLDFCRRYDFSGICFDWEFPRTPQEKDLYLALVQETVALFHPAELTVIGTAHPTILQKDAFYTTLDRVHFMAYEYAGRHSTYESTIAGTSYLIERFDIPSDRFVLGIPFYGRIFRGEDPNYRKSKSYKDLVRQFGPFLPAQNQIDGYYFNGKDLVNKKTQHAISEGLYGVMVWEVGQDAFGSDSLLTSLSRTAKGNKEPPSPSLSGEAPPSSIGKP